MNPCLIIFFSLSVTMIIGICLFLSPTWPCSIVVLEVRRGLSSTYYANPIVISVTSGTLSLNYVINYM